MCVSAVVETDPNRIAALLGLAELAMDNAAPPELPRRVEANGDAWIVRLATGGRLVAEHMGFNPYIVRRLELPGDMWASSLLGANHGLLVLKGFSEWVAAEPLLRAGLLRPHDVNCAFNRATGNLLLANFTPRVSLLVPVLYDLPRDGGPATATCKRDFVILSDEATHGPLPLGVRQAPLSLSPEAALEWLHTEPALGSGEEAFAIDFADVLAEGRVEAFSFSLYKSA